MTTLQRRLGSFAFSLGEELGLPVTYVADPAQRGTFYQGTLGGMRGTIAIDDDGDVWIRRGNIDLTEYGFIPFTGTPLR